MRLKEIYQNGCTCKTKNFGVVKVVNDESHFKLYKKMGLDVFETKEDIEAAKVEAKELKDLEKAEEQRLKERALYQKDKKAKEIKIAKDLKNAEKKAKELISKKD